MNDLIAWSMLAYHLIIYPSLPVQVYQNNMNDLIAWSMLAYHLIIYPSLPVRP